MSEAVQHGKRDPLLGPVDSRANKQPVQWIS